MLSLLRSARRGRSHRNDRDDDENNNLDDDDDERSPLNTSPETSRQRRVGVTIRVADDDDDNEPSGEGDEDDEDYTVRQLTTRTSYFDYANGQGGLADDEEQGGEDAEDTPLLPIFSAAHLDRLPLYNTTHAIRLLIVQRCETTLSWDQLRSPQVSQFVVKPIQSQIRADQFNRATLCALIANSLQFQKESQVNPGNAGVLKTRALVSELLAMRLIREYSTRELIDALSYDFDPLQGLSPPGTAEPPTPGAATPASRPDQTGRFTHPRSARVSTVEIAIRAQSKRFLAHPVVVQHLEAIWAGTIVFHSAADSLHRKAPSSRYGKYGAIDQPAASALPVTAPASRKANNPRLGFVLSKQLEIRRSVTLYDPRDASLFKLSRLRVPRYRQLFSTLSFATMLGLFLAVLVDRSLDITALEILFWIWSAGYMLDEVVGFSEQGFGLYILSFWNAFDLGILLLFIAYYCLRLYGILLADEHQHRIANMAYDVLASTAILLFPRLFSVLDHYRYFSQLLIAFRMMAQDLIAILILILISCSGFFVAFTLSFSDDRTDGNAVAYALFQILMGFTPAAWDKWSSFNILGKMIMTAFLIIGHFLIVTILITVLTNSFMAIVQNANEEHQFLFAVNTISMVKSDALFSYIAPTNVLGWLCSPLRYIMPFRQYVKLNRTLIKITHFPVLFVIFVYERLILSKLAYEPTDLVEKQQRVQSKPLAFSLNKPVDAFTRRTRLREPSIISFRKDRALDEVFRRPFRGSTMRTTVRDVPERRTSSNAVDQWMQEADEEGGASPPIEQPRSVLDRLETRRPLLRRTLTGTKQYKRAREFSSATRSVASDPDILSKNGPRKMLKPLLEVDFDPRREDLPHDSEADGDDEDNDNSEQTTPQVGESATMYGDEPSSTPNDESSEHGYFPSPAAGKAPLQSSSVKRPGLKHDPTNQRTHGRNVSSTTTLYAPPDDSAKSQPQPIPRPVTAKKIKDSSGAVTPTFDNSIATQSRPKQVSPVKTRPIIPPRAKTSQSALPGLTFLDTPMRNRRDPSFNARALDLASDIGDNRWGPTGGLDPGGISGMPASFSEQMLRERELEMQRIREELRRKSEDEDKAIMNRIMLSRMNTLEEGFREVLQEIKGIAAASNSRKESEVESNGPHQRLLNSLGSVSREQSETTSGLRTPTSKRATGGLQFKSLKKGIKKVGKGKEAIRPTGFEGEFEGAGHPDSVPPPQTTNENQNPGGTDEH